ncbi:hypothetical protein GCM10027610_091270 [Dactylosporangium cerinum]
MVRVADLGLGVDGGVEHLLQPLAVPAGLAVHALRQVGREQHRALRRGPLVPRAPYACHLARPHHRVTLGELRSCGEHLGAHQVGDVVAAGLVERDHERHQGENRGDAERAGHQQPTAPAAGEAQPFGQRPLTLASGLAGGARFGRSDGLAGLRACFSHGHVEPSLARGKTYLH